MEIVKRVKSKNPSPEQIENAVNKATVLFIFIENSFELLMQAIEEIENDESSIKAIAVIISDSLDLRNRSKEFVREYREV